MTTAPDNDREDMKKGISKFWSDPGRRLWWLGLTLIYLSFVCGAIIWATSGEDVMAVDNLKGASRSGVIFGGLILSLAPTFYWWKLSLDFQVWINSRAIEEGLSEERREFEREWFKTNQEFARAVWASVLAVFLTFIINID